MTDSRLHSALSLIPIFTAALIAGCGTGPAQLPRRNQRRSRS
jgi:hypothetical protein